MLIEFSVTNFRSIKEKQTLSLVSSTGDELKETNITTLADGKLNLVRSATIYGPNASGKSNLIEAIQVMQMIILSSVSQGQRGVDLAVIPYQFDHISRHQPSEFEAIFISQGVRYQYGFAVTREQVIEEWLYAYPEGRPQVWIDRKWNTETKNYSWGPAEKLKGKKQFLQELTRPNALFLSKAIESNNQQLQPVFDWFASTLRFVGVGGLHANFTLAYSENLRKREQIIQFLRSADFTISDLEITEEKLDSFWEASLLSGQLEEQADQNGGLAVKHYNVKTVHLGQNNERFTLDMSEESHGTLKFFVLAGPWLDVLQNGDVLVVDELNNNLHPKLVQALVQMFHNNAINKNGAQLIFTTHETSILSQEVFRRDQIWFIEKDEYNATTLYPLSDFSPRKGVENLEKNYLQGRYGALPYFRDVVSLFSEAQL